MGDRTTPHNFPVVQCDQCGQWYTLYELAETIEEYLCEYCASGIGRADEEERGDG